MKVFGVVGVSTSGKTTLVVNLVKELVSRGYTVGTVKSIGCGRSCSVSKPGKYHKGCSHSEHGFTIDTKGKNSFKHREAGASMTATWAEDETALIIPRKLSFEELVSNYNYDFMIVEGFKKSKLPKILTGISVEDLKNILDENTFAISGKIADGADEIMGIKTYKTLDDIKKLVDIVISKVDDISHNEPISIKLDGSEINIESVKTEVRKLLYKLNINDVISVDIKTADKA